MDVTRLGVWLVALAVVTGQAASKESDNIVKMSVNANPIKKMSAFNILEEEIQVTENHDASSFVSDANAKSFGKMSAFNILEEEHQFPENRDASSVSEETHRHKVFCNRTHYCKPRYTCCKIHCGKWGCCPPGYKCPNRGKFCYRENGADAKSVEKMPAFKIFEEENQFTENRDASSSLSDANAKSFGKKSAFNILEEEHQFPENRDASSVSKETRRHKVFCNRTHYCKPRYTCCKIHCGKWGCCPPGYKCPNRGKFCYRENGADAKSVEKMPAFNIFEEENQFTENRDTSSSLSDANAKPNENMSAFNILEEENQFPESEENHRHKVFCNRRYYCPKHYTCCRQHNGRWGCLPPGYKCHRPDNANAKLMENTLVLAEKKCDDVQGYINADVTDRTQASKLPTEKQQEDGNTEFMGRIRASELLTEVQHDDVQDDANAELPQRTRTSKLLAKEQHGDVQVDAIAELTVHSRTIEILAEGQRDDGQDDVNTRLIRETPASELRDAEQGINSLQADM